MGVREWYAIGAKLFKGICLWYTRKNRGKRVGWTMIKNGIDIIEIERVRFLADLHMKKGARFFTLKEIAYCQGKGKQGYASFAGIFAAKEAFVKALGTGFRLGTWTEIEVDHDEWGAPFFQISGEYKAILAESGAKRVHLSISHSKYYAVAQVILEG